MLRAQGRRREGNEKIKGGSGRRWLNFFKTGWRRREHEEPGGGEEEVVEVVTIGRNNTHGLGDKVIGGARSSLVWRGVGWGGLWLRLSQFVRWTRGATSQELWFSQPPHS